MTDTGRFPDEGQPENAGALPGHPLPADGTAPADPGDPTAYAYLDHDAADEDDLLLMPGAQGAWSEQPTAPGGTHETGGRDTGSLDYTSVRAPAQATAPAPPRRPLHLGPPVPEPNSGVVRSLADRGPAAPQQPVGSPARPPAPPVGGVEYLDVPPTDLSPAEAASADVPPVAFVPPQHTADAVATANDIGAGGPATAPDGTSAATPQPPTSAVPTPRVPEPAPVMTVAPGAAQALVDRVATTPPGGTPVGAVALMDAAAETASAEAVPVDAGAVAAAAGAPVVPSDAPSAEGVADAVPADAAGTTAGGLAAEHAPAAGDAPVATDAVVADAVTPEQTPADAGAPVAQDDAPSAEGTAVAEAAGAVAAGVAPEPASAAAGAPGDVPSDDAVEAAVAAPVDAPLAEATVGAAPAAEPAVEPVAGGVDESASAVPGDVPSAAEDTVPEQIPAAAQVGESVPGDDVAPPEPLPDPVQQAPAAVPAAAEAQRTAPAPGVPAGVRGMGVMAFLDAPIPQAVIDAVFAPEAAVQSVPAHAVAVVDGSAPEGAASQAGSAADGSAAVTESAASQTAAATDGGQFVPAQPVAVADGQSVPAQSDAVASGSAPAAGQPADVDSDASAQAADASAPQAAPAVATEGAAADGGAPEEVATSQVAASVAADGTTAEVGQSDAADGAPTTGDAVSPAAPAVVADSTTPAQADAVAPLMAAPATGGEQPDAAAVVDGAVPAQADAAAPQAAAPATGGEQPDAAAVADGTAPAPAEAAPADTAADIAAPQAPAPAAAVVTDGTAPAPATAGEQPAAGDPAQPDAATVTPEPAAGEPAGDPADGYADAERAAVHRVMRERRDIRKGFRTDPVPHEVLLRVLEAAHTAPSVGHSQPWDFVVIRSAETRKTMHELVSRQREAYAKSLPKARAKQFKELKIEAILDTPVNIVVTADPTRGGRHTLGRHTQPQMAPYSSALAVENLWLAARAEGLGVGWVSFFDEREMVRALGLPEHLEVVAYLCVGYVDEFPEEPELMQAGWSKRRPLSWVVHEEEYGNRALPGEDPHDLLAETLRGIRPLDAKALGEAWERQKRMTKPSGALGMLEIISAQLCGLSRKCPPPIPEPAAVAIFAGDHGVHNQGVTAWPQEVTSQMVANFLGGGAVCNAFANQVGAEVCVVDVGVAGELPSTPGLLPRKIRPGTSDFTTGPAMTRDEAMRALEVGIETARDLVTAGNKALLTGEMGIANTTVSAALISVYTGADPAEITGRGTGINDEMHARKIDVVRRALELHQPDPKDPIGVLAAVGGLEHAAMVGLILGGASLRTPVILDGVSAGAAALVARAVAPEALAACIAGHRSAEPGHVAALTKLGLRPLVDLDLRLGEGTGALLALPIVQSAARAMHEVATFDTAGVSEKG
ncbi:nicotinate-nucleotide--dimethylbenzimidazole phosphoribosyltransferase [Streptomyces hesseae]|uniref:Nicotinate-nucleotide--dimethylbenzimidazole phosphoribosyltransferase n=1 Tax=Streptomyces hesseae TaxID=3075519 RepID=A0ABU2SP07_9ACTN|nr:nicotinate-nucleotide--dimethylbenzimidazole phosphoribosyltransferase [Streptomyces sp. DSM 40473]MDT0449795.1 nicotinate-nucleotide--dimethylbenzimidazole phosphoribosyltransferase [Streptomyces sp. DSM 40473]